MYIMDCFWVMLHLSRKWRFAQFPLGVLFETIYYNLFLDKKLQQITKFVYALWNASVPSTVQEEYPANILQ